MYQYLIYYKSAEYPCYYTHWYDYENNYEPGMIVIDLLNHKFTDDGIAWKEIEEDRL